jgi:hypothetical protein
MGARGSNEGTPMFHNLRTGSAASVRDREGFRQPRVSSLNVREVEAACDRWLEARGLQRTFTQNDWLFGGSKEVRQRAALARLDEEEGGAQ